MAERRVARRIVWLPVTEIQDVPPPWTLIVGNGGSRQCVEQGQDQGDESQIGVVDREKAKEPAGVEIAEVMGSGSRIQEDAGDQEAGKDEKQVDAEGSH